MTCDSATRKTSSILLSCPSTTKEGAASSISDAILCRSEVTYERVNVNKIILLKKDSTYWNKFHELFSTGF